ncbi:MAG: sigma-70 family RNA polymerase sigma factor [Mariprofundus sp.]|nr:sigma-70 family RNA polymerase sigma factor [Mariprofundus sp.]
MKEDNKKVEKWLADYGDYLFVYAMKQVQDRDVAFDLVQETLLGGLRSTFNGDSTERTWLTGILKHKVIDYIRKQVRDRKLISELKNDPNSNYFSADGSWLETGHSDHDTPNRQAQNNQLQQHLMQCVSSLSEQQRTIFILREINGESTANICLTYGISSSNVHVIMHRARLALCKCLSALGYNHGVSPTV